MVPINPKKSHNQEGSEIGREWVPEITLTPAIKVENPHFLTFLDGFRGPLRNAGSGLPSFGSPLAGFGGRAPVFRGAPPEFAAGLGPETKMGFAYDQAQSEVRAVTDFGVRAARRGCRGHDAALDECPNALIVVQTSPELVALGDGG